MRRPAGVGKGVRVIGKLVRLAAAGFCLISLLASVGAAWLWRRSCRAGGHSISRMAPDGNRYTVRSEMGRATLYRPPGGPPAQSRRKQAHRGPADDTAETLVGMFRNDQMAWQVVRGSGGSLAGYTRDATREDTAAALARARINPRPGDRPLDVPPAALAPPLVRALERPDQFAAAHYLLAELHPHLARGSATIDEGQDGTYVRELDGLKMTLHPDEWLPHYSLYVVEKAECTASVDSAQLLAIRDQWHGRLDVPAASVRYHWLVAATAVPPLPWLRAAGRRTWVRRRRTRLGLTSTSPVESCRRCGYDLRGVAAAARCSECGAAGPAKGAA